MSEKFSPRTVDVVVRKDGDRIPREIRTSLVLGNPETPGTLVFPGIAQDGRIPRRIASLVPETDVASALPYWEVPAEYSSIRALAIEYPRVVIEAWREAHDDDTLVANAVAESQEGIGVVFAEANNPEDFDTLVLLRPLGLSVEQMGSTSNERLRSLAQRAFLGMLQSDQSPLVDPWNIYVGSRIIRRVEPRTPEQMRIGLDEDMIPLLTERAAARQREGKRTAIIAGTRDELIRPEELRAAQKKIGAAAIDLVAINASHRSMATKRGGHDLQAAIDYINYPTLSVASSWRHMG
jgi:hypothetical protein